MDMVQTPEKCKQTYADTIETYGRVARLILVGLIPLIRSGSPLPWRERG